MRQVLFGLVSVFVLFGLDRLFATIAIETNAAGALLSPGGAVSLEAFVVAAAFALTRLAFALVFCLTAATLASNVVGWAWELSPGRAPHTTTAADS